MGTIYMPCFYKLLNVFNFVWCAQTLSNLLCVLFHCSPMTCSRFLIWPALLFSAGDCCHFLLCPAQPLKEKCLAPLPWIQIRGIMMDCHHVPSPKRYSTPSIYISKPRWCELWSSPVLRPVHVSFHWPPWFVPSIVSQHSFSTGVGALSLNNGSLSCN